MGKYFKKLEGDNIYLSPINASDVENFTEWINNFETSDYIGRSMLVTFLEQGEEFLRKESREEETF